MHVSNLRCRLLRARDGVRRKAASLKRAIRNLCAAAVAKNWTIRSLTSSCSMRRSTRPLVTAPRRQRSCLSRHLRERDSHSKSCCAQTLRFAVPSRRHTAYGLLSRRPAFVNCLHDFLGPPHRLCDRADCRWNSLRGAEAIRARPAADILPLRGDITGGWKTGSM
jgi:hypothetical protein